jgi:hypothetical protein
MACPTESLVDHTTQISKAFAKLKEGLLDKEDAFNLYVSTMPTKDENHASDLQYLVAFKIRLMEFKDALEGSHAAFLHALSKRRPPPPVREDAAGSEAPGALAKEPSERAGDRLQIVSEKVRLSLVIAPSFEVR